MIIHSEPEPTRARNVSFHAMMCISGAPNNVFPTDWESDPKSVKFELMNTILKHEQRKNSDAHGIS